MDKREELENAIEMLKYSIENMESQMTSYPEGSLEWMYAKKILDSCRETLAAKEAELQGLPGSA